MNDQDMPVRTDRRNPLTKLDRLLGADLKFILGLSINETPMKGSDRALHLKARAAAKRETAHG